MYRFMILVAGFVMVAAYTRHGPGGMPVCARVAHVGFDCCKKEIASEPVLGMEDIAECMQLKKKPPSCAAEICFAKKRGVASDDGTINQKAMQEYIDKQYVNDADLAESLKENCVKGDISKYGPADFCDLIKQNICFEVEIVKSCNEWEDEGECSGMKELAAECIKQFS